MRIKSLFSDSTKIICLKLLDGPAIHQYTNVFNKAFTLTFPIIRYNILYS